MPNWCENELTVDGPEEQLNRFATMAKGENGVLDANSFIPYPEHLKKLDEAHPFQGEAKPLSEADAAQVRSMGIDPNRSGYDQAGYDWCREHWGTKWNFYQPVLEHTTSSIRHLFRFATAWSPALPLVKKMGELFPELAFTLMYWEGGAGFQGKFVVEKGRVTVDESSDYHGDRGG